MLAIARPVQSNGTARGAVGSWPAVLPATCFKPVGTAFLHRLCAAPASHVFIMPMFRAPRCCTRPTSEGSIAPSVPLPGSVSVSHKAAGTTVTLPAVASTSIGMGIVSSLQRFSRMSASSARPNTAPVWNLLVRRIRGDHVHVADSTIRKVCASPARSAVRLYVAAVAARHAAAHRAKLPLTSQPLPPSSPHSAALVLAKLSSPSCIGGPSTSASCPRLTWAFLRTSSPSRPPSPHS